MSILAALLTCTLSASPAVAAQPPVAPEIMKPEEVRRGQRAVAYTVFEGRTIESFEGKVLGLVRNYFGPARHIVLVSFEGDKVRHTGIVHGMSGSPVYVDGKLLGALSLQVSALPKDPVAGITPITYMLDELDRPGPVRVFGGSATTTGGGGLERLKTPLVISGVLPEVLGSYNDFFEERGLYPVLGSSGGGETEGLGPDDLVPGAPVTAVMVDGDLTMEAAGTVTHREGDRLWAFGHPFTQLGSVAFPMAPASIVATIADQNYSYKVTASGAPAGTFKLDRVTAVVGELGSVPPMLPISVRFSDKEREVARYNFRAIKSPWFTPTLTALVVANSLAMRWDYEEEVTYRMDTRLRLEAGRSLRLQDVYSVAPTVTSSSAMAAAGDIFFALALLYQNPLEPAEVESVDIHFELTEGGRIWTLGDTHLDPEPVRPGESFKLRVRIRRFRGETRSLELDVPVPAGVTSSMLGIRVLDAGTLKGELRASGPPFDRASALSDLVNQLAQQPVSDRFYVQLVAYQPDPMVRHQRLPSLPPSALRVLSAGGHGGTLSLLPRAVLWETEIPVDGAARGSREIPLRVKR